LREDQPEKLWRLHWEDDPNVPDRHASGRWRFDAPNGSYPVTYANLSEQHVFVEVYGDIDDDQLIERQADRKLSYATLRRPIQVVDLGDSEILRSLRSCLNTFWGEGLGVGGRIFLGDITPVREVLCGGLGLAGAGRAVGGG
jgi:hypothetical protein